MATIMIIEDNLIYRELLRDLCEDEGHSVAEFPSAEDALCVLRSYAGLDVLHRRRHIDLFITDFNMGGMNGYEFIQEMRRIEGMGQVPIIMISSTAKDMRDLLKLENVAFLSKPCPNSALMVTVRNLLQATAALRGEPSPPAKFAATAESAAQVERLLGTVFPVHPPITQRPLPVASTSLSLPPAPPRLGTPLPPPLPPTAAPAEPKVPKTPPAPPEAAVPAPAADYSDINDGLKNSISKSAELTEFLISRQKPAAGIPDGPQAASPVADLIDKILSEAVLRGASDIHLEPQLDALEVRARVDGVLQRLVSLPTAVAESLSSRIKILCGLNITEKRLPQDGQFSWQGRDGASGKFRVSTLPALHGEKIVLRLLPSGNLAIKLDALGFTTDELSRLRAIMSSPNGLLLATGPTGSGKTTTLYTLLDSINVPERNITTVEDPVEYQLPGITQVQVNHGIGYTFEKILRSFLRQDPDVMLVGEIRDAETAEIALKAAATGHLVLSSLHTNDAVGAIHRLLTMGLPAYLVAASVRLVIAQRLVRKLCTKCRVKDILSVEESRQFSPDEASALRDIWRAKGCPSCHGSGYAGRLPIYELLTVRSHEMRAAIAKGCSPDELNSLAVRTEGMVPMRRKALQYVAEGVISIEEAKSILFV